jgi:hypothetical protein
VVKNNSRNFAHGVLAVTMAAAAGEVVAAICLFWGSLVVLVSGIGYWQM